MSCARSKPSARTRRTFSGKKSMGSMSPASQQPQPLEGIYTDSLCDAAACHSRSLKQVTKLSLNSMTTSKTKPQLPGVTYSKQRSRWIVRQTIKGKRKQIGSFKTLAEANALVANNSQNGGFDSNTLYASHSEKAPHPSRSQGGLQGDGDRNNKVSIGRNEAKVPTKQWSNIHDFHRWLDQQPATFWMCQNGDRATLIQQSGRWVQVEYLTANRGTVHYEVTRLVGSDYDFSVHCPQTHCFYTKRESTKAFNKMTAA
jgi:hypothetical protein